jgi:hypothetical protein
MSSTGGCSNAGRATKVLVLAEVNAHIFEVVAESVAMEEEWEFLCECGHPDCASQIALTAEAYQRLRITVSAILARGHQINQRERSRALRADARGL